MGDLIKLKRGSTANVTDLTPNAGEPIWDKERNIVKIGDGSSTWDSLEELKAVPEGWVNVKDFGAKGNANYYNESDEKYYVDDQYTIEANDDTIAFQIAINTGKPVYMPPGNYLITSQITSNQLTLIGAGRGHTIIKIKMSTDNHIFLIDSTSLSYTDKRVFISDITFTSDNNSIGGYIFKFIGTSNGILQRITSISIPAGLVSIHGCSNFSLNEIYHFGGGNNTNFQDAHYGIIHLDSNEPLPNNWINTVNIVNCYISNSGHMDAISISGGQAIRILNTTVESAYYLISVGYKNNSINQNITIDGLYIENPLGTNDGAGILLAKTYNTTIKNIYYQQGSYSGNYPIYLTDSNKSITFINVPASYIKIGNISGKQNNKDIIILGQYDYQFSNTELVKNEYGTNLFNSDIALSLVNGAATLTYTENILESIQSKIYTLSKSNATDDKYCTLSGTFTGKYTASIFTDGALTIRLYCRRQSDQVWKEIAKFETGSIEEIHKDSQGFFRVILMANLTDIYDYLTLRITPSDYNTTNASVNVAGIQLIEGFNRSFPFINTEGHGQPVKQMAKDIGKTASLGGRILTNGTATPTSGYWYKGSIIFNSNPSVDSNNMILLGWICTVSGEPGTWQPLYISTVSPVT